jgi:predicted phosphodiesterase
MFYITGDTHADYTRFSTENFPQQKQMTKKDYVIICGDFGIWDDSPSQKHDFKWLESKPFTTLFVDGNHENYDILNQIPVEKWNGGNVQFIQPSIIHLMRGNIYQIEGKSFFAMGGAASHDIDDGILDRTDPDFKRKKSELDKRYGMYRINHESWWKEEMPSNDEYDFARRTLAEHDNKVDYIISHCGPTSIIQMMGCGIYQPDALTDFLQEVSQTCDFKGWFFGHYHRNCLINREYAELYEQIALITERYW